MIFWNQIYRYLYNGTTDIFDLAFWGFSGPKYLL